MKAFRNIAGSVVEVNIDVDPDGNPLLPPDTTVEPRPEPLEGHYVTVVGSTWVQIPNPVSFVTLETQKAQALERFRVYRDWLIEQPVEYAGRLFDANETARNRLTQALVIFQTTNTLPQAWVANDNSLFHINNIDDLSGIINAVQTAFTTRFFTSDTIRRQILVAETEEQLAAVQIPSPGFGTGGAI